MRQALDLESGMLYKLEKLAKNEKKEIKYLIHRRQKMVL